MTDNEYLELRHIIGNYEISKDRINNWLEHLSKIYEQIAHKYGFTNHMDEMLDYLSMKRIRNADSHFADWIKEFNPTQQHINLLQEFVNENQYLDNGFHPHEFDLLKLTFERCHLDLRAAPRYIDKKM